MSGTVAQLAQAVSDGLNVTHPTLRKTVKRKLAACIAAAIVSQTANTAAWAAVLPIETERDDMRLQWISRLLANPLLVSHEVMEPIVRARLEEAAKQGQTIVIMMDQTDIGNDFAVLMLSMRMGDRALPMVWHVEPGTANIGFEAQQSLLDIVFQWIPAGATVVLMADRFYPSVSLFDWLNKAGWDYRLRLKRNHALDIGTAEVSTTGDFARGYSERYVTGAHLFTSGVETNIAVWHEEGHDEPWIIAMRSAPSRATVQDYGLRWGIESMFSDFKTRGFGLEDTQLHYPDRVSRLVLILALALCWCVAIGYDDVQNSPTPLEQKAAEQTDPDHWSFKKLARSCLSWFQRGLRKLLRCAEMGRCLPRFDAVLVPVFHASG